MDRFLKATKGVDRLLSEASSGLSGELQRDRETTSPVTRESKIVVDIVWADIFHEKDLSGVSQICEGTIPSPSHLYFPLLYLKS